MTVGPTASAAVTVAGADGFAAITIATVTVIVPGMSPTEPPATHWQGWFRVPGRLLKARTTNLNPGGVTVAVTVSAAKGRSLTVPQTAGGAPCGFRPASGQGLGAERSESTAACRGHRLG